MLFERRIEKVRIENCYDYPVIVSVLTETGEYEEKRFLLPGESMMMPDLEPGQQCCLPYAFTRKF